MKKLIPILVMLSAFAVLASGALAQGKKTIILIRHAEKDTSTGVDEYDPPLSAEGRERASRVARRIGKFRPGAIYSTNYKRTLETVEVLAKKRNKPIETYDPSKPKDLVAAITSSKTKRFVVVGHSNTIPPLANLLTGKDLFKNLQDSEHSVIWVIRLKNGKVQKVEMLDY